MTWGEPQLENKDKWKRRKKEPTTRAIWETEMKDKCLATWAITGGEVRKQIDYTMTNARYRNTERTARRNTHRNPNMIQIPKHRVQTTQINYNGANKYKIPTQTGNRGISKCDIEELRLRPENLTKRYQDKETEKPNKDEKENRERRGHSGIGEIQEKLSKSPQEVYPLSKKHTMPTEPEWVKRPAEWGTETEIRQIDYAYMGQCLHP